MRNPPMNAEQLSRFHDAFFEMTFSFSANKKTYKSPIAITVRQLEAVVRMSESLAKVGEYCDSVNFRLVKFH